MQMFEHGFFGNVLSKNYTDNNNTDFLANSSSSLLGSITAGEFFLCVIASMLLGFLISLIYMITHKKEGYAQSYVLTIIMLPSIVTLILLLINTTYGALSLAGAFTLVRFRSVPGDPNDITLCFLYYGCRRCLRYGIYRIRCRFLCTPRYSCFRSQCYQLWRMQNQSYDSQNYHS